MCELSMMEERAGFRPNQVKITTGRLGYTYSNKHVHYEDDIVSSKASPTSMH